MSHTPIPFHPPVSGGQMFPFLASVLTGRYQVPEDLPQQNPLAWTLLQHAHGARLVDAPSVGQDLERLAASSSPEERQAEAVRMHDEATRLVLVGPSRTMAVRIPLPPAVASTWLYSETVAAVALVESTAVPEDAARRSEARNWAYGRGLGGPIDVEAVDPWTVCRTGVIVHLSQFAGDDGIAGPWAVSRFALGEDGCLLVAPGTRQFYFVSSLEDQVLAANPDPAAHRYASSYAGTACICALLAVGRSLRPGQSVTRLPSRDLRRLLEARGVQARRMPWIEA